MTAHSEELKPGQGITDTRWLCALAMLLTVLAAAYQAKGHRLLLSDNQGGGGGDLRQRWLEQRYVQRGQNPYDVIYSRFKVGRPPASTSRDACEASDLEAPDSGGYPPWAFFSGYVLLWPSWPEVRLYYVVLNALAVLLVGLWAARQASSRAQAWLLFAGTTAISAHCTSLLCGQYGALVTFKKMELRTTGMEFASEMVIQATLRRMKIAEVPTTLSPDGRSRPPHLRPWRDGWRHLRFMLLHSPRWLFFYPGVVLLILGLVLTAWLLPQPRTLGGTIFDVHTLLYAVAGVLVGFQAIVFGVLSRHFAEMEGLLPASPRINRLLSCFTLERGLIAGLVLILAGFVGSIAAVLDWWSHSFGPLDPSQTLRIAIPSVAGMILGFQIMLAALFLGVMRLRGRPMGETNDRA